ncbi:MAG: UpxY family transcription antiterminator [Prevotella sp.]|nr:UpxY family transcription antiterminator [Prevotella sp.]
MSNVNEKTPSEATRVTDSGTRSFAPSDIIPQPSSIIHHPSSIIPQTSDLSWFPMYVTYARELDVQEALDKAGVENFLPMQHIVMRVGKKIVERDQPAIHNLIFLHSNRTQIRELKMFNRGCQPLQYMTVKPRTSDQASVVITIPERQMLNFMRAMQADDPSGRRTCIPYTDFLGQEGRQVRFVSGSFAGVEGTIKRVNNNRSVVIALPHVACLVIPIDHITDIQFL